MWKNNFLRVKSHINLFLLPASQFSTKWAEIRDLDLILSTLSSNLGQKLIWATFIFLTRANIYEVFLNWNDEITLEYSSTESTFDIFFNSLRF